MAEIEGATPEDAVAWAWQKFAGSRVVVTTGFGMEGCVLVDLLAKSGRDVVVHYLDTHFLFAETHELRARLEARYANVMFVNAGTSITPEQQELRFGPELWKTDPDTCCGLRKVEPMRVLLQGAGAWVTGLRRGQSATRAAIRTVE
ncbi:MAG: phosphoadenosine phosphosulfate reductase family protein, partial [Phycisphaerales bacterium]|nr:phosphoadenosine phosphosulfate reductase family protein [Phycisphaerales bacterium]